MNTKLITALLILLVVWVGYRTYVYYGKVQQETAQAARRPGNKNTAEGAVPALPYNLQITLDAAKQEGATGLKNWLDQ